MVGEDLNYTYTYDTAGNLLKVQANGAYHDWNDYTNTYTYGNNSWKDLLTKFNNQAIAYEGQTYSLSTGGVSGTPVSGNPISYFNGTRWAMDWAEGRNLVEAETSTETTDTGLSFAYDASGLRTEKTVVTKTYETVHTHAYTVTVIEPTCTEGGYTLHECDCGDSYQDNETDPLGHDYVESGVDTYTCTRCGSSYTTHTHSYTATVVEPTCTERGYTLYECACGHSYQSNFTNALDHDYVKVREDYQYYYYECTRCGKTYRSPIYHIPVEPKPPIAVAGLTPETEINGSQQVLVSTVTEEHSYIYAGGMLLRETITSGSTTKTLDFRYDNVGYPYALIYNNGSTTATYYYITNLQGDVMYLVDSNGNQVAAYTYDPYGKILSATGAMAEINPLRYRGYYYDSETGFYYLQSRYYDPNTCRFINADGYASTGQGLMGYNMFAYCNNNSVNSADPAGYAAWGTNLVSICDGSGTRAMISTTDGRKESQDLLDDVKRNNGVPVSNGTVRVHVEYAGVYSKDTDQALPLASSILGVISSIAACIPGIGPVASGVLATVGVVTGTYGTVGIISDMIDPVEDGDYHKYKITMTWTDSIPLYYGNPNSGYYTVTDYIVTDYYIWNDARFGQEYWCRVGHNCEFVSTTVCIP